MTLEQIRKQLPKGNWRHSRLLEYADASFEFGITYPDGFLALTDTEKAYLVARLRAKRTMQAFDEHQSEKASKRSGSKV